MFVIQNIRQPEQFYYADYLSNAKRYKTKAGAERAIAKYQPGYYIIIDEALIGTSEHQQMFIAAHIEKEKKADIAYREHSQGVMPSLPELSESHFQKLAENAWNQYVEKYLTQV